MSKIRPAPDRRSADQGALRGPDRRHGADRRKRIRHTIETTTPVVVRGGGMIQWGLARNWSAGGMLIEVGSSIGIGEAVEIKISGVKGSESAPEAVTVKGEVRHQLAWRYGEDSPGLYQSHPWVLVLHQDGSVTGLLADSYRRGEIHFAVDGLEFAFEGGPCDFYLIEASSPAAALPELSGLCGPPARPPRWALGYHQCRWGYSSREELLEIAAEFRRRDLACDALWLDIEHLHRRRVFSFHPTRFPDPKSMLQELHDEGFKVVGIHDPGVVTDEADPICARGLAEDHFVRDAAGKIVTGRVWPGLCHFPDFLRGSVRDWWAENCARWAKLGFDGIWNDMNEPSVMRSPTRTLPEDCRHGDENERSHAEVHNLYGHMMNRASRSGLARAWPDRRPFVLSRSGMLGSHREAAAWTGDNQATWTDLRWSLSMTLSLAMSGQALAGADVGGFEGDPTPELFCRWFELGAWLPFFRGHSDHASCRKEPWSFGRRIESRLREILRQRMRMTRLFYSLMLDAAEGGLPPVRPLFFVDPTDRRLHDLEDQFMVGDDLMVAPVLDEGARRRRVILPAGHWYRFDAPGPLLAGGGEIEVEAPPGCCPVFVKAGVLVPLADEGRTTEEATAGDLTIAVFPDPRGRARGRLLEDAGDGHGDFRRLDLEFRPQNGGGLLEAEISGSWCVPPRGLRLRVHDSDGRRPPVEAFGPEAYPFVVRAL